MEGSAESSTVSKGRAAAPLSWLLGGMMLQLQSAPAVGRGAGRTGAALQDNFRQQSAAESNLVFYSDPADRYRAAVYRGPGVHTGRVMVRNVYNSGISY